MVCKWWCSKEPRRDGKRRRSLVEAAAPQRLGWIIHMDQEPRPGVWGYLGRTHAICKKHQRIVQSYQIVESWRIISSERNHRLITSPHQDLSSLLFIYFQSKVSIAIKHAIQPRIIPSLVNLGKAGKVNHKMPRDAWEPKKKAIQNTYKMRLMMQYDAQPSAYHRRQQSTILALTNTG